MIEFRNAGRLRHCRFLRIDWVSDWRDGNADVPVRVGRCSRRTEYRTAEVPDPRRRVFRCGSRRARGAYRDEICDERATKSRNGRRKHWVRDFRSAVLSRLKTCCVGAPIGNREGRIVRRPDEHCRGPRPWRIRARNPASFECKWDWGVYFRGFLPLEGHQKIAKLVLACACRWPRIGRPDGIWRKPFVLELG